LAPCLAPETHGRGAQVPSELVRPAGFEPATRCLEGRFTQGVNLMLS
jgi:hypothetical protein